MNSGFFDRTSVHAFWHWCFISAQRKNFSLTKVNCFERTLWQHVLGGDNFSKNWFLIRWSLSKECPLVGKFSASDLRNDISEFDSRHDVTMSISYQIIHCKKDLKNEIPKSFKETSYFWLKIICKNVQPRLFPVFIHWNNLTNHNKPNIKVIISWSIWVVVQTLFKCLSFSLIL